MDGNSPIEAGLVSMAVNEINSRLSKSVEAEKLNRQKILNDAVDRLYPDPDKAKTLLEKMGSTPAEIWEQGLLAYRTMDFVLGFLSNPKNHNGEFTNSPGPLGLPFGGFHYIKVSEMTGINFDRKLVYDFIGNPYAAFTYDRESYDLWYGGKDQQAINKAIEEIKNGRERTSDFFRQVSSHLEMISNPEELLYALNYSRHLDWVANNPGKTAAEIEDFGLKGDKRVVVQVAVDKLRTGTHR
jgi:hypothetical protein